MAGSDQQGLQTLAALNCSDNVQTTQLQIIAPLVNAEEKVWVKILTFLTAADRMHRGEFSLQQE